MRRIRCLIIVITISIAANTLLSLHTFADDSNYDRNTAKGQATIEMWNMIQQYSDPNYFKGKYRKKVEYYERLGKLSGKNYKRIQAEAKRITADCKTDYKKMKAVAKHIATSTYYDYPNYTRKTKSTNLSAVNVWKNKRTVCQGYANLYYAMLYSLDIPCMYVTGNNHVYNAVYDKSSKRWVFVDVAWCSSNKVTTDGKWEKGEFKDNYFDMNLDYLLSIPNHEIYSVEGVLKGNVYYEMYHGTSKNAGKNYVNKNLWHWTATCQNKKKSTVKIVSKIGKYRVTEIGYDSFYDCPHIRKVVIPTTITKIGEFSFCLKKNKRLKTKIISKSSKKKLRVKKNYTWWGRRVSISKK